MLEHPGCQARQTHNVPWPAQEYMTRGQSRQYQEFLYTSQTVHEEGISDQPHLTEAPQIRQ